MSASVIFTKLFESFGINCEIFFMALVFSLPLGLVVAFGSMNRWAPFAHIKCRGRLCKLGVFRRGCDKLKSLRPVSLFVKTIVWIVRGTPLMLQIIIIFYGPGLLWDGTALPRVTAAVVAFIINYACYFSEIYRGGIESIPVGQKEAGQVLGMKRPEIFFRVTLLQVVKRIIPPMGNEIITLIKDTALANIIANKEIIMMAKEFAVKGLIWPLFSTAIFFLVFCGILTILFNKLENKLSYFN